MQTSYRRNSALSLLLFALVIGSGSLALVEAARDLERVELVAPFMAILVVAYVVAHMIVRKTARQADSLILPLAAILNALGLAAIYRLSPRDYGPIQVTWTAGGAAAFIATPLVVRGYK